MEIPSREQIGTMPQPIEGVPANPEAGIYPSTGQRSAETIGQDTTDTNRDAKERTMQMGQATIDKGSQYAQMAADTIHDYTQQHPEASKKSKVIAISTIAAAGIGIALKKRSNSKTGPEGFIEKAKDLIPSR